MRYTNKKIRSAFTLLEILVAMSIILLILGAVYGSYRAMSTSISRCSPKTKIEKKAMIFLMQLTRELRCCYPGRLNQTDDYLPLDRTQQTDEKESPQEELFTGDNIRAGTVFLQFVTTSAASSRSQQSGGLSLVSYKLDDSETVLLRSVRRYTKAPEENEKDYKWLAVLSNIKYISSEYLADDKWQKEWNSKDTNSLPQIVKISLSLETEETGTVSYETSVHIMCHEIKESKAIEETTTAASGF